MIVKVSLLAFFFAVSHQTDIELQPFDYDTTTSTEEKNVTERPVSTTPPPPRTIRERCQMALNVSVDALEASNASDYISCYWRGKKLLGENGEIDFILLKEMINHAAKISVDVTDVPLSNAFIIAGEIMEDCKATEGKTHGEKAAKMRNCMYGKLLYQRSKEFVLSDYEDIPYLELSEEACVIELSLDPLRIEDLNRHYIVVEDDADFQNFLECYWKDVEYMDRNGTLNVSLLQTKLAEDIELELLSRSKAVYLTDVLTSSILKRCKTIASGKDGDMVLRMYNYIYERLPYFRTILQYE